MKKGLQPFDRLKPFINEVVPQGLKLMYTNEQGNTQIAI
jgi:hypothetical protein